MATCSSIPPWEIPGTEEPSRLRSMGLQWVGHDLAIEHWASLYLPTYLPTYLNLYRIHPLCDWAPLKHLLLSLKLEVEKMSLLLRDTWICMAPANSVCFHLSWYFDREKSWYIDQVTSCSNWWELFQHLSPEEEWRTSPVFLLDKPMDRGAWWATGVACESGTT